MYTAGKITLATAFFGILVFAFVFLFNVGKTELTRVEAQGTASTKLTVLNTPPTWVASSSELVESSVTSPTNSGDVVTWTAIGSDPNGAIYYLLVCDSTATPTARANQAPICNVSAKQWGVSTSTLSGHAAYVSTTTAENATFPKGANNWYAWVCDTDPTSPRCSVNYTNGTNASNTSPFVVNYRPTFTSFSNSSPADPNTIVTFYSTSTDTDSNNVLLIVCSDNVSYSTTTNNCGANTLATTTVGVPSNATALYLLKAVLRDGSYNAYGYLVDQFGHEALGGAQGTNKPIIVSNVAPTTENITLNNGTPITLTPGVQQTGYTLTFTSKDANSCSTATSTEVLGYEASIFRSPFKSTSTCSALNPGDYDQGNNCYTSAAPQTTWNLLCTASSTSCVADGVDATQDWSCTFPLWFITTPTDVGTPYAAEDWRASVIAIDNNNATGSASVSAGGVDVISMPAISLLTAEIPYGALEPGQFNPTLAASTTIVSQGNTALDQNVQGDSMCNGYTPGSPCATSASSTVPANLQQFATSSLSYGSGQALSSTTPTELELNVKKSTSTTTPFTGSTYWGISVPGTITFSGAYTGMNTISAVMAEIIDWE